MAGVSRLRYANEIRLIRVMCSGRVDLEYMLRAFSNGQDGVFVGGCKLGECNYTTWGNFDALANTYLCKKILSHIGLNPDRMRISFMNSSDGIKLAENINDFRARIVELGPIGRGDDETADPGNLKFKIDAMRQLVPYIRLVERERLRPPVKTAEAYTNFYESPEVDELFKKLVLEKFAISQISMLLKQGSLSTAEIAEKLGLNPSEVSKYLIASSRYGFVRYDESQKRYAAA